MRRFFSYCVLISLCLGYAQSAYSADIKFTNFQFSKPDSEQLETQVLSNDQAVFSHTSKRAHYQLTFIENYVADSSLQNQTAREIAEDYRKNERQNMIEMGVNPGLYELENLSNGEEELGGKLFYTMTYVTRATGVIQFAQLYLYFPNKTLVSHFLAAHYSESASNEKHLSPSFRKVFFDSLASVSYVGR